MNAVAMDRRCESSNAVRWLVLAVVALAVAGLLAAVLVVARVPALASALMLDPELARRSLVVHVNLATGAWFFAFVAALFCLGSRARFSAIPIGLASAGVLALTASTLTRAPVVLSDYVPVIDHWLFFAGLAAFAGGFVLETLRRRPVANVYLVPPEVQVGLRASALAFAIAMLTIVTAHVCRIPDASRLASLEHLYWGGGHVLQFAATAGMLSAWLFLVHNMLGASVMSSRLAAVLFGLLLLPTSIAPVLVATRQSPRAFTLMMELGIAPVVLVVITQVVAAGFRARNGDVHWPVQPIARTGLLVGIAMTLIGFALGAAISGDTTLTPAHYHISIGAVTASFMATLLVLLARLGTPLCWPRLATWQPLIYGGGQTIFALGLAIAGFWGNSGRKLYGPPRLVPASSERLGWIVAGIGGLLAFVGGVVFVAIVLASRVRRERP